MGNTTIKVLKGLLGLGSGAAIAGVPGLLIATILIGVKTMGAK